MSLVIHALLSNRLILDSLAEDEIGTQIFYNYDFANMGGPQMESHLEGRAARRIIACRISDSCKGKLLSRPNKIVRCSILGIGFPSFVAKTCLKFA
jgi:hypothetical protein